MEEFYNSSSPCTHRNVQTFTKVKQKYELIINQAFQVPSFIQKDFFTFLKSTGTVKYSLCELPY